MPRRATLRASDADRESVAERLRDAASEGRLHTEELEHRLESLFAARTYGQLDELTSDLPVVRSDRRRRRLARPDWMPREVAALMILIAVPVVVAVATAVVLTLMALMLAWSIWIVVGWVVFQQGRSHAHHRGYQPPLQIVQRMGRYARDSRAFRA